MFEHVAQPAEVEVIQHDLRAFLSQEVLGGGVEIGDDAVLSEVGVDSFALMEVVLFVERRFGVVLPVDQLTRENTRSVRALAACLASWMARTRLTRLG
jgi:acyl carrier protein